MLLHHLILISTFYKCEYRNLLLLNYNTCLLAVKISFLAENTRPYNKLPPIIGAELEMRILKTIQVHHNSRRPQGGRL